MITPYSFNGILLNPDDKFFRSDLRGAFSSNKSLVLNDLLQDGEAWGRSKIKERTLVLNIIAGSHNLGRILLLNSIIVGNGTKELIIDTDIGRLTGYAEVVNFAWSDVSPLRISCQLTMPDPYWYSTFTDQISLGGTTNAPLILPAVLPWTLGSITGASGNILNQGNTDAYPVITIVGNCSNISISNDTTGESISVSGSLSDSDTLIIDCRPATCGVWLNGVPRIDLKTTPGWIRCVPWWNTFIFNRTSLQTKKHCTVALQSRWI